MNYSKLLTLTGAMLTLSCIVSAEDIKMKITKKYLNLPVSQKVDRAVMTLSADGKEQAFDIRLAPANPDYWVFCDVSQYKNKNIVISYKGDNAGMDKIYQADEVAGHENMYKEENRPLVHYTQRRGIMTRTVCFIMMANIICSISITRMNVNGVICIGDTR